MVGVGIVGCGSMGTQIAEAVSSGAAGEATLVALFDADANRAKDLAARLPAPVPCFTTFAGFLAAPRLDLVVEAANQDAVRSYAESILEHGKDLLMVSTGALTNSALFLRLCQLAQHKDRRLLVPSGALGGIDAIRAASGQLEEVTLTTTKPPEGFRGAPGFKAWESREITRPQVLFQGPAVEAVRLFPANVNVAATLSLAGMGPEKTQVKVVADPASPGNVHEVFARGRFGTLRFRMELRPDEKNPKTSALAILSAIEALRAACSSGPRIGT